MFLKIYTRNSEKNITICNQLKLKTRNENKKHSLKINKP